MTTDVSATVTNWKGSIVSHPARIVRPTTVDEIVNVLSDPATYPSPVRAVGSNHSTTRCAVAEGGTVIDMTGMDRIIEITGDSVTVQAGALYIDVAKALEQRGLQFYVNVELGNLTVGSGSCGGTKDASMPGEFGQVASYAIGFTLVLPSGDVVRIGEEQPELLRIVRSSYGLLGIVVQVTFRVRPLAAMSVQHVSYRLGEFLEQLPQLKARKQSMMFFLMPFLDRVIVEYRQYHAGETAKPNRT
ncbi:MAG: FAD-binding oxidoreductase, partial [Caldilineaceae bacterium]|nr:FAD-binding oxidoreductase [Caldilineaceae bacterium]